MFTLQDDILKLRLQGLTTQQIANVIGCSRRTIEIKLKDIYNSADATMRRQLDNIKKQNYTKARIDITEIDPYLLGIIWGMGRLNEEGSMFFRHRHRYFLEQIQSICDNEITTSKSRTGIQYRLKSVLFDELQLQEIGWSERNSDSRRLPILDDYKDFLRAYLELHSSLDYSLRYGRNKKNKWRSLRLRIYGNTNLLEGINDVMHTFVKIPKKSIEIVHNNKTGILNYPSLEQIESIFMFIEGVPYFEDFWHDCLEKLKNPRKEV